MPGKNIFAISGSLRSGSSNYHILRFLKDRTPTEVAFTIYDGLAKVPPFDPGLDDDQTPDAVAELRSCISHADALIICTPEYAFGVPGQLKNALDWLVSSGTLVDKPVALITASSSGQHAHSALLLTLGALSANILQDACLLIHFIRAKMDGNGNGVDEEMSKKLKGMLEYVLASI